MPARASKRPRRKKEDEIQAARRVVDTIIAKTESGPQVVPGVTDEDPNTGRRLRKPKKSAVRKAVDPAVSAAAAALSKLGASKGGEARAASMSPKERSRIAKKAAAARWTPKRTP